MTASDGVEIRPNDYVCDKMTSADMVPGARILKRLDTWPANAVMWDRWEGTETSHAHSG